MDDYVRTLVLDVGSGLCKAGFAADEKPISVFPSLNAERSGLARDLMTPASVLPLGEWSQIENVWRSAYDELKVTPGDSPIMLTESILSPKANREFTAQMLFETFRVPAIHVAVQSVLGLFGTGRVTGLVVDIGDSITRVVPVVEGGALPYTTTTLDMGGRRLNSRMNRLLESRLKVPVGEHVASAIKENLCYVGDGSVPETASYQLPDGNVISVGDEQTSVAEVLFDPSLEGIESPGLAELVQLAISSCEPEVRGKLYESILVIGGTGQMRGVSERLCREVEALAPSYTKVRSIDCPDRQLASWTGASMLAVLPNFATQGGQYSPHMHMWVTKDEYDEAGPAAVHRKSFFQ